MLNLMAKCTECGARFVGTPENPPVADHLCRYCEIKKLKHDNALLRKALSALVGADSPEELSQMEHALRLVPGVEQDKISAINAIHALQQTAG